VTRALGRALVTLALLAAWPIAASAQVVNNENATAIVLRAARVYKNLSGLQADFRQRLIDEAPGMGTRDSRGTIYQSGSTKFAMRWSDPAGDAVIVDGTNMWMYVPSEYPKQVVRYPMPTGPVWGANFMGYFLENPTDRYRISYVKAEVIGGVQCDAVLLEPTGKDMNFRRATLWFARSDNLPHKLEIIEQLQTRVLMLTRVQPNVSIPPEKFVFVKPAGVSIKDQ
jgi:outer membrane lipoprotein-sorting protein